MEYLSHPKASPPRRRGMLPLSQRQESLGRLERLVHPARLRKVDRLNLQNAAKQDGVAEFLGQLLSARQGPAPLGSGGGVQRAHGIEDSELEEALNPRSRRGVRQVRKPFDAGEDVLQWLTVGHGAISGLRRLQQIGQCDLGEPRRPEMTGQLRGDLHRFQRLAAVRLPGARPVEHAQRVAPDRLEIDDGAGDRRVERRQCVTHLLVQMRPPHRVQAVVEVAPEELVPEPVARYPLLPQSARPHRADQAVLAAQRAAQLPDHLSRVAPLHARHHLRRELFSLHARHRQQLAQLRRHAIDPPGYRCPHPGG